MKMHEGKVQVVCSCGSWESGLYAEAFDAQSKHREHVRQEQVYKVLPEFRAPWGEKFTDVTVRRVRYVAGNVEGLELVASDGEVLSKPTLNLWPETLPPEGHVIIKAYSEGEGMAEELVRVGLIELTGKSYRVGPYESLALEAKVL